MKLAIILCLLGDCLCCGTTPEGEETTVGHGPNDTQFLGNLTGWGVPDTDGKSWKNYIKYYKNVTQGNKTFDDADASWNNFMSQSHGKGFPKEWQGYGPGSPGNAPPPWAYIAGNYGRPYFCFQFPAFGTCDRKYVRWAFNPQTQVCQMFFYSGCGGNENNFRYKASCQDACSNTPASPCEPQEKIDFMELLNG
ncbi:amyloid beta precursor like protein 2-like [Colias croceus]|uniref:amyloid beta precursor like protein 2-like n=1 Tax=Colias crocea TaxID=72248 RepID=UPI001E281321|nr:amyloid beta precursor like protein 2-like [Colias croceus]